MWFTSSFVSLLPTHQANVALRWHIMYCLALSITGQKLSVCLCVNHGDTRHNRCA